MAGKILCLWRLFGISSVMLLLFFTTFVQSKGLWRFPGETKVLRTRKGHNLQAAYSKATEDSGIQIERSSNVNSEEEGFRNAEEYGYPFSYRLRKPTLWSESVNNLESNEVLMEKRSPINYMKALDLLPIDKVVLGQEKIQHVPFTSSASVLRPNSQQLLLPNTNKHSSARKRGSLKFPSYDISSDSYEYKGNLRPKTPIQIPSPHINEIFSMNLREFEKAGGFAVLGFRIKEYAFDGLGSIIYKTKDGLPITNIQRSSKSILKRPGFTAVPSPLEGLHKKQREVSFSPEVTDLENNFPNAKNFDENARTRKRYYNNIAEIIQAQDEGGQFSDFVSKNLSKKRRKRARRLQSVRNREDFIRSYLQHRAHPAYQLASESFYYPSKEQFQRPAISHSKSHVEFSGPHSPHTEIHEEFPHHVHTRTEVHETPYHEKSHQQVKVFSSEERHITKPEEYHQSIHQPKYALPHHEKHDYYKPIAYRYGYDVKSPYHHTRYQHQEARDGDKVSGEYRVALPDGRVQIVTYTADENGYRPYISYVKAGEPHGNGHHNHHTKYTTAPKHHSFADEHHHIKGEERHHIHHIKKPKHHAGPHRKSHPPAVSFSQFNTFHGGHH